ncbi:hypothetical protein HDV05_008674 [Chytridiales sp. JEL 0842]|nr:hypothetical protein HDV05_008674 [Chytridiales sp. JEL 0842]
MLGNGLDTDYTEDPVNSLLKRRLEKNTQDAIHFLEHELKEPLPSPDNLQQSLKDGVILCRLMNKLFPESIPTINHKRQSFMQMENISHFLSAARDRLSIPGSELFSTVDLYEGKNMQQVVLTLLTVKRRIDEMASRATPTKKMDEPLTVPRNSKKTASVGSNSERRETLARSAIISTRNNSENRSTRPNSNNSNPFTSTVNNNNCRPPAPTTNSPPAVKPFKTATPPSPTLKQGSATSSVSSISFSQNLSSAALQQPVILSNYQLGNIIGRGQFGAVYKALNVDTGEVIAIKRIPIDTQNNSLDSLLDEVNLLKGLSHPNITRYLGFIMEDGHLNIILEYIENGSMQNMLKTFGVIPERLCRSYVKQILDGLVYLHEFGVVHCDLKCANVLTTKTGAVKLSDFGVSKQLSKMEKDKQTVVGTPNWMAPEIISLRGASTTSDIWSLACTIVEMVSGYPPYWNLNPMTSLFKIVEEVLPPLPEGISKELVDFLTRCFEKDCEKRMSAVECLKHPWICGLGSK